MIEKNIILDVLFMGVLEKGGRVGVNNRQLIVKAERNLTLLYNKEDTSCYTHFQDKQ